MTEIFKSFEKDFIELLIECRKTIAKSDIDSLLKLKSDLAQAEKYLKQMEIEVSMMPITTKGSLLAKTKRYRKEWQELDNRLQWEKYGSSSKPNKDLLIEFSNVNDLVHDQKLAKVQNLALDQRSRLENGKKVALETEGIAIDTMTSLKAQRDVIANSTTGAREISRDLGKSNNLINTMQRRSIANKLIMFGIIFLLIATIGVVVYEKFNRDKSV
ncbi:unnamed protein product [Blepharisma stoltei]|uniref:Vesicle transport v-SNARE N-terminal domain-containing protein n=1 Tax=Blepharisma stoltei TaxID=1481888 RepID=A0AAU9JI57_9CILI|nr:unnamed protein product [Blepharisma stoltei]